MSGAEAAAAAADDPWPSMARQWPVVEPRLRWSWCRPGATYKEAVTLATLRHHRQPRVGPTVTWPIVSIGLFSTI